MSLLLGPRPVLLLLLFLGWIWTWPHPPHSSQLSRWRDKTEESLHGAPVKILSQCPRCCEQWGQWLDCQAHNSFGMTQSNMQIIEWIFRPHFWVGVYVKVQLLASKINNWVILEVFFYFFWQESEKWTISVILIYVSWTTVGGFTATRH